MSNRPKIHVIHTLTRYILYTARCGACGNQGVSESQNALPVNLKTLSLFSFHAIVFSIPCHSHCCRLCEDTGTVAHIILLMGRQEWWQSRADGRHHIFFYPHIRGRLYLISIDMLRAHAQRLGTTGSARRGGAVFRFRYILLKYIYIFIYTKCVCTF